MARSTALALALLVALPLRSAHSLAPASDDSVAREYATERVTLPAVPHSQRPDRAPLHVVGDALRLGDATFPCSLERGTLRVATSDGGRPRNKVRADKAVELAWKDASGRREVAVRFVRDDEGTWRWFVATAHELEIAGETIRLVDCDGDGRFGELDADGYCVGESTAVVPLEGELVLGTRIVSIESVAPDGGSVVASVRRVEGTPPQLAALLEINRARTTNGLTPVRLDPELSAGCTAHAKYLELHGWDGRTDPHDQTLGPKGATPEGREAAQRSNIVLGRVSGAGAGFWRTYYHRIPMMHPGLDRIGVNAEPEHIGIIDVGEGLFAEVGRRWTWDWSVPVSVPANGAVDFPTSACGERPQEPVPDLGSRGCPIMLQFRASEPPLVDFAGTLRREAGGEVPVLVADSWRYVDTYGIVPERPLEPGTWHVAELSWTAAGERVTRRLRFRTQE